MPNCKNIRHERNFLQVDKEAFLNKDLSLKAKGLLAVCMAFPPDWDYNIAHLITLSGDGKNAIYSAIDELMANGYCYRHQVNTGRFGKVEYFFYETVSLNPHFKKSLPRSGFTDAEKMPLLRITGTKNKKEKYKKEIRGGDEPPCVPSSRSKKVKEEKIQVATNVFLTPTQEEALKKRLEGTGIEPRACYEKLSDWYIGKGKSGGKNDYLAITNWVIDAVKDGNSSKNASNAPKNGSSNMVWAKTLVDKLNAINALPSSISMFAGNDGINFQGNNAFLIINYREHGFKEQVINRLRKMGIVLQDQDEGGE